MDASINLSRGMDLEMRKASHSYGLDLSTQINMIGDDKYGLAHQEEAALGVHVARNDDEVEPS